MKKIIIAFMSVLVTACSMQAPPYQASIENVQMMKVAKLNEVNVGAINSSKKLNKISLRGSSMFSPIGASYGEYLSLALTEELKLAKIWSGVSATVITGEFIANDIDVSGFSKGTGEASVKFIVKKGEQVLFDKVVSANHEFDSSFVGAIAIPNGQKNYVNLVQKLIKNLFEDPEFISVLK